MKKVNVFISLTAVIVLWVSAAIGQDVIMKRQEPRMKSVPVMKASPSTVQKSRTAVEKKKRSGKARTRKPAK